MRCGPSLLLEELLARSVTPADTLAKSQTLRYSETPGRRQNQDCLPILGGENYHCQCRDWD
jgi:hypothetical protein